MLKAVYKHSKNIDYIYILLILVVGSFFRLYKINTVPYGLNNDAAWEGSAAIDMLHGNFFDYFPYAAEGWRGEGIIRLIVAYLTVYFGPDPITIKLSSVAFGIGLLIPLYFLVRFLFNQHLAFITALLVAVSGWHITMSKTGWRAIAVPFFATIIFYYLFRSFKILRVKYFILCGAFLAGSFYIYDAARSILPLFVFWISLLLLMHKDSLKKSWRKIGLLLLSFVFFVFPMFWYAMNNWSNFTSRSSYLFLGNRMKEEGNLSPLLENLKTTALLFTNNANGNDFFISESLLDKPISFFFVVGLVVSLFLAFYKKSVPYFFMLTWFISALVPGLLSIPNGNRGIGAIPAVYFFSAVAIYYCIKLLTQRLGRFKKSAIVFLAILLLLVPAVLSYRDYLGPKRRELRGFYPETMVVSNYIKHIWDDYEIFLTDNYPREILTYSLYKPRDPFVRHYTWLERNEEFLEVSRYTYTDRGKAFFMFASEQNEGVADILVRENPNAKKFYIWYKDDNINRPASLVVLIPRS